MDAQPHPPAARTSTGIRAAIGAGALGLTAGALTGALPLTADGTPCGPAFKTINQFADTYACIDAITAQRNVAIIILAVSGLLLAAGVYAAQAARHGGSAAPVSEPAGGGPADRRGGSDRVWIVALVVLVGAVVALWALTR